MPRTKNANVTRLGFTVSTKRANEIKVYAMLRGLEPEALISLAVDRHIMAEPLSADALSFCTSTPSESPATTTTKKK